MIVLDVRILIKGAWRPTLEQLDDQSLMDVIANCGGLGPNDKWLLNEYRLWMCIICMSELDTRHWRGWDPNIEVARSIAGKPYQ